MSNEKINDNISYKKQLIIIISCSIFVRCIFILLSSSSHFFTPQWNLSKQYFKEGYGIAAGYGYIRGEGPAGDFMNRLYSRVNSESIRVTSENAGSIPEEGLHPEMLHPPGMAILIALLNRVFGVRADVPIQLFGMFLDTISALILYWIVKNYLNRNIAFITAIFYAIFPPLAYASSVARLPEGLLSFFIIAFLASLLKGVHSSGKSSILWYTTASVCLGLGCYLRPDYMLLPVLMTFAIWLYNRNLVYSVITMSFVQISVLILLLPWAYRNHEVSGKWIFTSSSVGATLITGLAEYNNPWGFGPLDSDRHEQARIQGFSSAWEPEADQYFRKLFIESIEENPSGFLKSIAFRIPLVLFTPYDWGYNNPHKSVKISEFRKQGEDKYQVLKNRALYFTKAYWDRLLMGLISIISFIGVLIYLYNNDKNTRYILLIIITPHIYSMLTHLVTHIEDRFLIPSVFSWLIGISFLSDKILYMARNYLKLKTAL